MTMLPPPEMVQDAVNELQIRVWDRADDARFRLTVYEPLREGKKVGGIGGLEFLDYMGAYAGLGPEHSVLEFGCWDGRWLRVRRFPFWFSCDRCGDKPSANRAGARTTRRLQFARLRLRPGRLSELGTPSSLRRGVLPRDAPDYPGLPHAAGKAP